MDRDEFGYKYTNVTKILDSWEQLIFSGLLVCFLKAMLLSVFISEYKPHSTKQNKLGLSCAKLRPA